jgi:excisionase family DNA binding protein
LIQAIGCHERWSCAAPLAKDADMTNDDDDGLLAEYAKKYPPLITSEEAAEIARVPIQTVYAWSSEGRLDSFKVRSGRRVLFKRDPFIKFLLGGAKHPHDVASSARR